MYVSPRFQGWGSGRGQYFLLLADHTSLFWKKTPIWGQLIWRVAAPPALTSCTSHIWGGLTARQAQDEGRGRGWGPGGPYISDEIRKKPWMPCWGLRTSPCEVNSCEEQHDPQLCLQECPPGEVGTRHGRVEVEMLLLTMRQEGLRTCSGLRKRTSDL